MRHAFLVVEFLVELECFELHFLGLGEIAARTVNIAKTAEASSHAVLVAELLADCVRLALHFLGTVEIAPNVINNAEVAVGAGHAVPVAELLFDFECLQMHLLCLIEIAMDLMVVAEIGLGVRQALLLFGAIGGTPAFLEELFRGRKIAVDAGDPSKPEHADGLGLEIVGRSAKPQDSLEGLRGGVDLA